MQCIEHVILQCAPELCKLNMKVWLMNLQHYCSSGQNVRQGILYWYSSSYYVWQYTFNVLHHCKCSIFILCLTSCKCALCLHCRHFRDISSAGDQRCPIWQRRRLRLALHLLAGITTLLQTPQTVRKGKFSFPSPTLIFAYWNYPPYDIRYASMYIIPSNVDPCIRWGRNVLARMIEPTLYFLT